jgi:hypothetical protein
LGHWSIGDRLDVAVSVLPSEVAGHNETVVDWHVSKMSLGSRIAIGVTGLICGWGFWLSAMNPDGVAAKPIIFQGLTLLCVIIAIACFVPKSHPLTLRVIGGVICGTYIFYVIDSLRTNREPGRAISGLICWGLPGGYLAIAGQYPTWGKGAAGFNANQQPVRSAIKPPRPKPLSPRVAPTGRQPRRSWQLSDLDSRRLTIGGWLLLLVSGAIFGFGFLMFLALLVAAGLNPTVRLRSVIVTIILMAIAVGVFWLGKFVLGLFGVAVVKD